MQNGSHDSFVLAWPSSSSGFLFFVVIIFRFLNGRCCYGVRSAELKVHFRARQVALLRSWEGGGGSNSNTMRAAERGDKEALGEEREGAYTHTQNVSHCFAAGSREVIRMRLAGRRNSSHRFRFARRPRGGVAVVAVVATSTPGAVRWSILRRSVCRVSNLNLAKVAVGAPGF